MKKSAFVTGLAVWLGLAASAQQDGPPKPPPPPQAPVAKSGHVAPPPPPSQPPPPPRPKAPHSGEQVPGELRAFLKRNPSVKSLDWHREDEVIVRLQSGKEERYNLADAADRKEAEARYGQLPQAPPPPPPPAPPAPPEPPKKKGTLS